MLDMWRSISHSNSESNSDSRRVADPSLNRHHQLLHRLTIIWWCDLIFPTTVSRVQRSASLPVCLRFSVKQNLGHDFYKTAREEESFTQRGWSLRFSAPAWCVQFFFPPPWESSCLGSNVVRKKTGCPIDFGSGPSRTNLKIHASMSQNNLTMLCCLQYYQSHFLMAMEARRKLE